MKNHFYNHLKDAIVINSYRKKYYAKMSGNRSFWVSLPLILLERMLMPFAFLIDRAAAKFQKGGIPIVANDFVDMDPLPSCDSEPMHCNKADLQTRREVRHMVQECQRKIRHLSRLKEFLAAAHVAYDLLQAIRNVERERCCHFAMTRHLVESLGFTLLHAPQYAKESGGKTVRLSSVLARMHLCSLSGALWLDKQAGPLHERGIGILVNDVPHIPFEEEFLRFVAR